MNARTVERGQAGFTLTELMVAMTILALLMAVSLAPVRAALHNAKLVKTQKRIKDAGDLWCISRAGNYPPLAEGPDGPPQVVPLGDFSSVLSEGEVRELAGLFGGSLPLKDGWGGQIEYRVDIWPDPTLLLIRSPNADGEWEAGAYMYQTRIAPGSREPDIVYANCDWVQAWTG